MDRLMHLLLIVMVLDMIQYKVSYLQVYTQMATSQTFFIFMTQCEYFAMFIFSVMAFAIDNLIEVPLITPFLDVSTIILNGILSNIVKIRKIKCVIDNSQDTKRKSISKIQTNSITHYNTIDSIRLQIKRNDAMVYVLQQMDSIVLISFYVFFHNEVERGRELEFKFENENGDCGEVLDGIIFFTIANGFNYNQLSPRGPSSILMYHIILYNYYYHYKI